MGLAEARDKTAVARVQLERVQNSSHEESYDAQNAVMWAFYAYENCVVALAELHGRTWTRNHYEKAELARRLHADGLISRDIGDELEKLNTLRKGVAYDLPDPGLDELDIDDLANELKALIDEIEVSIESAR